MRLDFEQIFQASTRQTRGDRNAVAATATPSITIPRIGSEVPERLMLMDSPAKMAWIFLLKALAERFPIPNNLVDLALQRGSDITAVAAQAVGRLVADLCGPLEFLHIRIQVTESGHFSLGLSDDEEDALFFDQQVIADLPHLILSTEGFTPERGDYVRRLIKPAFDALKSDLERSLFYRAMRLLDWAQYRYLTLATPAHCKSIAEHIYWRGNASEVGYFEELVADVGYNDAKDMFEACNYTHGDLKGSLGPTMYLPRGTIRLTESAIRIAASHPEETTRMLAAATLAMTECIRRGKAAPQPILAPLETECTQVAAILQWKEGDDTVKIIDDFFNDVINSGYNTTESFGYLARQVNCMESARYFVELITTMCAELKAINQLISVVSVADTSY